MATKSKGISSLVPPAATPEVGGADVLDINTVISNFDQHLEDDKRALQNALNNLNARQKVADAEYETKSQENSKQRQLLLDRLAILTSKSNSSNSGVVRKIAGRKIAKAVTKGTTASAKSDAVSGEKKTGGRYTDKVLGVLQKMKGAYTNSEIAAKVMEKYPDMNRTHVNASLQSLRGRMVDGKQVSQARVKVTGTPREYKYRAIV